MENCEKNRELVGCIGDLVEALFTEVAELPISDGAKNAMVMIMVGDILKRRGSTVSFQLPLGLISAREVAA